MGQRIVEPGTGAQKPSDVEGVLPEVAGIEPPSNLTDMDRSWIRVVMVEAQKLAAATGQKIRMLMIGSPNFGPPDHVRDAGADSFREDDTGYGPGLGLTALREALAQSFKEHQKLDYSFKRVFIVPGGMAGLLFGYLAVAKDKAVLIPSPFYPNYKMGTTELGRRAVEYRLDPADGFQPDVDYMERAFQKSQVPVGAILINSPHNPTGTVWSRDSVERVVRLAEKHNVPILYDACYDRLVYDGAEIFTPAHANPEVVIYCNSFSKTYAMPAWRLGGVLLPSKWSEESIIEAYRNIAGNFMEASLSGVSTPCQKAGLAALTGPQEWVGEMRDEYQNRRNLVCAELDKHGVPYVHPQGAFYVLVDVSKAIPEGLGSCDFALNLLEAGVGLAPGRTFGAEGWVRIAFCQSAEDCREGADLLGKYYNDAIAGKVVLKPKDLG